MTIQIQRWDVDGPLPVQMAKSDGRALALVKAGDFAADLIEFDAGRGVRDHVHAGNHILIVVSGLGWVDYDGEPHRLEPGVCYLVPGSTRHAIRADTHLRLLSIADDHRDAGSEDRLVAL